MYLCLKFNTCFVSCCILDGLNYRDSNIMADINLSHEFDLYFRHIQHRNSDRGAQR